MAFRWNIFFTYLPILAQTSVVTFQVVGLSVLFSAVLGLGLAMLRMSKNKVVSGIARVYIEVIRGVPLLVQILWLFFGLTLLFGLDMEPVPAGVLNMTLWGCVYFAEIYRSGLSSIHRTQYYAGYSLGTMWWNTCAASPRSCSAPLGWASCP